MIDPVCVQDMTMSNKQQGNVFSQLIRLGGKLDREIDSLTEAVNNRNDDSEQEGSAILILQDMLKDLLSVKKNAQQTHADIQDDGGFMRTVPLVAKLLESKNKQLEEMEKYLSQYGYTPLHVEETQEQESEEIGSGEDDEQEGSKPNDNNASSSPPYWKPKTLDGNRTPKLEDFGLSNEYLAAAVQWKPTQKQDSMFKKPSGYPTVTPQSLYRGYCQQDPFGHESVCITPGLLGGKEIPLETPENHRLNWGASGRQGAAPSLPLFSEDDSPVPPVLNTPGIKQLQKPVSMKPKAIPYLTEDVEDSPIPPVLQSGSVKQIDIKTSNIKEDSSSNMDDSPVPPEFQTPGLKLKPLNNALRKSSSPENSPVVPTFATPGLRLLKPSCQIRKSSSAENSPVVPTFATPGLCLIKPSDKNRKSSSAENSPVVPTFATPGLCLIKPSDNNRKSSSAENSPVVPTFATPGLRLIKSSYDIRKGSLDIPTFATPLLKEAMMGTPVTSKSVLKAFDDAFDSPVMPELTTVQLTQMTSSKLASSGVTVTDKPENSGTNSEQSHAACSNSKEVSAIPSRPMLRSQTTDPDTPIAPELTTVNLTGLAQHSAAVSKPNVIQADNIAFKTASQQSHRPVKSCFLHDEGTPVPPDLQTVSLKPEDSAKAMAMLSHQQRVNAQAQSSSPPLHTTEKPKDKQPNPCINTFMLEDDDDIPKMPELTTDFEELKKRQSMRSGIEPISYPSEKIEDTTDKENRAPSPEDDTTSLVMGRLMKVTTDEYSSLPSYLTRQFSLEQLNKTMRNVNAMTAYSTSVLGETEVKEKELRALLASSTDAFVLIMMKLHRIQEKRHTAGVPQAYIIL